MKHKIKVQRLAGVAALAMALALPAGAQTTLTPDTMRGVAAEALRNGDPTRAKTYAEALLRRDPKDLTAHLIHARALRDLGQLPQARHAASVAWQMAQTDDQRYAVALVTAQILSTAGKRTRAQFWLRRAAHHAPNDLLQARAARDYKYVQQRNPWHSSLSFTLAPNSNINNGSARDRSELNYLASNIVFGTPVEYVLSGNARALSGFEIGGSARTRYRFKETATTAHDATMSLSYRTFLLSGPAKSQAASVAGSDFAFGNIAVGYGYRKHNRDRKGEFTFEAEGGQSWYGGAQYASYARVDFGQSFRPTADRSFNAALNLERHFGQATPDLDKIGLKANVTQRLASGATAYFGAAYETTWSPTSSDSEYQEVEIRAGYVPGAPVMGTQLQFGVGVARREFDTSRHSANGRQENRYFADVTATFNKVDYYGFNPTVTLSASHTQSNVGLYDLNRVGLRAGFHSAF
ncbi:surface lipoprotein assembly modifier [Sulfitobacter brevis]|nr:surface lipoprotein assembly modifier [Sulfitobacter brevis]